MQSYLLFYITTCLYVSHMMAATLDDKKSLTKRNHDECLLELYKTSDVAITTPIPELTEFTACVWIKSVDNKVAIFSYAISDTELDEITAFNLLGAKLYVDGVLLGRSLTAVNDSICHHLCFTWTSVTGRWEIYIDGVLDESGYNGAGSIIKGGGVLVLGQLQNVLRGGYIPGRAFVGQMTKFNMWGSVLSSSDIGLVMSDSLFGDVYHWDIDTLDLQQSAPGGVEVKKIDICTGGAVSCDPHFTTLDGRHYSHQGVCWYTLVKHCSDVKPDFQITAKFEPRDDTINDEIKTRVVAINITVGDEYVNVDRLEVVRGNTEGPTKIDVFQDDGKVLLSFTLKDTTFKLDWTLRRHIFNIYLSGSEYRGSLCGLLGNYNGNSHDDFQKPDGTTTDNPVEFGESWKIPEIECN